MVPSRSSSTARPTILRHGPTTLAFEWSIDRWHHVFTVENEGRARSWRSVDQDDQSSTWPPSPPVVEVWSGSAGSLVAVGRSGRSHFSLSAVVDPLARDALRMEWACRLQEPAVRLASTYEGPDGARIVIGPDAEALGRLTEFPATILWSYRVGPAGIERVGGGSTVT